MLTEMSCVVVTLRSRLLFREITGLFFIYFQTLTG